MGSFTVVATRERGGIYFTAVPYQWVQNNTLLWPEDLTHSERECLRSNPCSVPQAEWATYTCIEKYSNIETFSKALQIEKQLTHCVDTDAEETLFVTMAKKRCKTKPIESTIVFDRNDLFVETSNILPENVVYNTNAADIILPPNAIYTSTEMTNEVPETLKEEIKTIVKGELINIQNTIKHEFKKLYIHFDKLFENSKESTNVKSSQSEPDLLNKFTFPLSTMDDITALENEIKGNTVFKQQLINFLIKIGGTTGEETGTKVGYKLADYMFRPDLLLQYSWTGIARGKSDVPKRPFLILEGILDVFHIVIGKADCRYTKQKNCSFFKDGILKHAKKRNSRKRLSVKQDDECGTSGETSVKANLDNEPTIPDDSDKENTPE